MKMIPCSPEAEKALLGILLTNNAIYEDISDNLQAKYFSDKANEGLFSAISKIIESGKVADVITLKNYAEKHLSDHGGHQYLLELVATSYHTSSAIDYSFMIKDLYTRRKLISAGQELVDHAFDLVDYPKSEECIEMIERQIFELTDKQYSGLISLEVALQQALVTAEMTYRNERQTGILTGLIDLDRLLGGFHAPDLVIIAGRPSMGKTALATSIAINILYQSPNTTESILFFSMEMSAEQIGHRILSQVCSIESDKIRKGQFNRNDLIKYIEANKQLSKMPLYIDDTPSINVSYMRILARRTKNKYGNIKMIIVDYLQLLRPSAGYKFENRVQEISEMTRQLKAIAKEIGAPMVVLSQLSRASEKESTDGEDHYKLSYLRDSGSIEQDSDVVIFIDRLAPKLLMKPPIIGTPQYEIWKQRMAEERNTAILIIAKNRHGPTARIKVSFNPELAQFGNFAALTY